LAAGNLPAKAKVNTKLGSRQGRCVPQAAYEGRKNDFSHLGDFYFGAESVHNRLTLATVVAIEGAGSWREFRITDCAKGMHVIRN
jgi:hypothetical protein